jgi:hypothetical protein
MSTPELNFLTAARSQIRFDVGVRNFHFEVFLVDSRMDTCRGASTSWFVYLMAVIALFARWASSRWLYPWTMNHMGITREATSNSWITMWILQLLRPIERGTWAYHTLLLFCYANHDLDKPALAHFGPVTPPYPDMAMPCPKDTCRNPIKLPMMPCFLGMKLSCGLVLTGCWARLNYNLVFNCAGSPRRLLR